MRIVYTASRNLATGHTAATEYQIVVLAQQLDRRVDAEVTRQVSLDRSRVESELRGFDQFYSVLTDHIAIGQNTENFEEFLWSCANGETFEFDPDSDAVDTEVSPQTAILDTTSYSPQRNIPGHYQYQFTVRIL